IIPAGDSFSNEITVTVNPTPTASASSNTPVCTGQNIVLNGTTDIGTSFSWTGPNAFVSASEDPAAFAAVAASGGVYTFTASTAFCSSTPATTSVVVNATPVGVTANASDLSVCDGDLVDLTSAPGAPSPTILTENFNAAPAGWTTVNNSTGGTPANAAWTLRPSPFSPAGSWTGTISSDDATQYYFTNGDAQGNGSVHATQLISPAMDLTSYSDASLSFWHFYRDIGDAGDNGFVEVSTNGGGSWTAVQTYTTTQGAQAGFVNAIISLNSFAGQSSVMFRFRYEGTWDWGWAVDNVSVTGTPVAYTYGWVSAPPGFISSTQSPTGVAVSPVPTTYTVTVSTPFCNASASVTVNPDPTDTDGDTFPDCTDSCPT
ncbi:MAG TPA: hypothetical protein PK760_15180, partial [Flavobacteriales bacterium]|nr:hypothetical protein [Flavobacteriales bacterium]